MATGGMAASTYKLELEQRIADGKAFELSLGVDGFLIYDLKFLPCLSELFKLNKSQTVLQDKFEARDLLTIPKGLVTKAGLEKNIKVGILFIASWMQGQGTFILDGSVEDSATAEISRFQVWQWIKHAQALESNEIISLDLVKKLSQDILENLDHAEKNIAHNLFLELVQDSPQFITTWLNERPEFKSRFFAQ